MSILGKSPLCNTAAPFEAKRLTKTTGFAMKKEISNWGLTDTETRDDYEKQSSQLLKF